MRYQTIPDISFIDIYGRSHAVKDLREYPKYSTASVVGLRVGDKIDEIVTSPTKYGDDSEGEVYKVVESNIEDLYEAGFDLSKLKSLKVPVR